MIRALIVDDEPLARERLRMLLGAQRDVEIIGECGDGAAAVTAIEREQPDLLLLDIRMPEIDGFEVLEAVETHPPAIIFVTAYDQHALRAFEAAAVDYLLKPIDEDRFTEALDRARVKLRGVTRAEDASAGVLLEQRRAGRIERFVVRNGDRVSFVRVEDVEWIEAAANYVRLFAGGRTHLVRSTLRSVESQLDPGLFVRIHRSVLIHIDRIASMQPYFHGEWTVTMRDGTRFTSSRSHSERLRKLLR